jgi:hypothetical protein
MPESDLAAATVVFTQLARMHIEGIAGTQWVGQKTEEVLVRSGYPESIMALPLARLYRIADEWGAGDGPMRNSPGSCGRHARSSWAAARS